MNDRAKETKGLSLDQSKALVEKMAADMCASVAGSFWHWLGDRRIRVYAKGGAPIATLHVESIQ